MIKRKISVLAFLISGILFSGCGGTKCLIKDCSSLEMSDQVIEIQQGEQKEILKHKSGIIWGGYAPGLFVADTNIVSVSYSEIRRGHKAIIEGKESGSTKVYLVNMYGPGAGVKDSTERAYWLEQLDGSKLHFTVIVE